MALPLTFARPSAIAFSTSAISRSASHERHSIPDGVTSTTDLGAVARQDAEESRPSTMTRHGRVVDSWKAAPGLTAANPAF